MLLYVGIGFFAFETVWIVTVDYPIGIRRTPGTHDVLAHVILAAFLLPAHARNTCTVRILENDREVIVDVAVIRRCTCLTPSHTNSFDRMGLQHPVRYVDVVYVL